MLSRGEIWIMFPFSDFILFIYLFFLDVLRDLQFRQTIHCSEGKMKHNQSCHRANSEVETETLECRPQQLAVLLIRKVHLLASLTFAEVANYKLHVKDSAVQLYVEA